MLDQMEAGGVIARVQSDYVKCVSPTKLVPKDTGKSGMTKTQVIQKCNDELRRAGRPPMFKEVPNSNLVDVLGETFETVSSNKWEAPKTKWQIVHAYKRLNDATKIPNFAPGDLHAKQQKMAGKAMGSVIDLASGYYAVAMDDNSVPFTAFYVPGRGYYVYLRMPMGLTGTPTTFCEMVVSALDGLLGADFENWMDDICTAHDSFEEHLAALTRFLDRVRATKLSIAPSKMKIFQAEFVFAGA
ncbi:unnamed protein product [Mycena citricolor]|uniref:Reverse transcriptase domain-containing protein n=1 Tax=Mycena citricolor TaxID=2018698 RepID=A0AAD2H601_9AGAR|nr:unnamed protein product [Mycena citricolor]